MMNYLLRGVVDLMMQAGLVFTARKLFCYPNPKRPPEALWQRALCEHMCSVRKTQNAIAFFLEPRASSAAFWLDLRLETTWQGETVRREHRRGLCPLVGALVVFGSHQRLMPNRWRNRVCMRPCEPKLFWL